MIIIRILGGIAVFLLISISLFINANFGYERGDNELQHIIFGLGSFAFDLLKIYLPWPIARLWASRHKDLLTFLIAMPILLVLWCGLATWSLISSLGFTENSNAATERTQEYANKRIDNLKARLIELNNKRDTIKVTQEPNIIKAQALAILSKPVSARQGVTTIGSATKNCLAPNWRTKKSCAKYHALKADLVSAQTYMRLSRDIAQIKTKLLEKPDGNSLAARTRAIRTIANLDKQQSQFLLTLLMVAIVEFGSAIGPYLIANFKPAPPPYKPIADSKAVADPDDYFDERLEIQKGARTRASDLYADFSNWCLSQNIEPVSITAFGNWLTARHPHKTKSVGVMVYLNITFRRS